MKRAIVVLFLSACASGPQWHKEGATKEATEADLYICGNQAPSGPMAPRVQGPSGMPSGLGGESRAAFNAAAEREGERMQKDQKAVAECMRAKGYSDKR